MDRKKKITERFSRILDFPIDTGLGKSFFSMSGREMLRVENAKGLLECTETSICFHTSEGAMRVTGSQLMLGEILSDLIVIKGQIKSIEFLT